MACDRSSICLQGRQREMAAELFSVGWQFDFSFAFQYLLPKFATWCWACIHQLRNQHGSPCCPRAGPRVFVEKIHKQGYALVSIGLERFMRLGRRTNRELEGWADLRSELVGCGVGLGHANWLPPRSELTM